MTTPPELNRIYLGDALSVMKPWPDAFVQTVVTSPPYWGLRDYNVQGQIGLEKSPDDYVKKLVQVFREVKRVLRKDGTLWLNMGDSYADSGRGAEAGSTLEGSRHSQAECRRVRVRESAACGIRKKNLIGIPWRLAFALQEDGWFLRSDIIWAKPNPMPESVTDRPTKAHEYIFLLAKSERYYYDAAAIKEPSSQVSLARYERAQNGYAPPGQSPHNGFALGPRVKVPSGWAKGQRSHHEILGRYKPLPEGQANLRQARAKQRGHDRPHVGFAHTWDAMEKSEQCSSMRNKRSVWTVATSPFKKAHFATFPPALIKPCILAGAPPGGLVFDPFIGTGTTALVAAQMGRQYLGIDLNPDYAVMRDEEIQPEKAQIKMAV